MRHTIPYLGGGARLGAMLALLVLCASSCCASHSLSIKNNTGAFVTVAARDTGQGVGIPAGKQREVPFRSGPMVAICGSNMWFYPKIAYETHPDARHHVFRFGICQAGF